MIPSFILAALVAGAVDTPCQGQPAWPPELVAWRAAVYAPGNRTMIPPPAEPASAYRAAYLEARKTDWADLCHHRDDNTRLKALPQSDRDVVFIGDSITEGWKFGDPAFFARGTIGRGVSGQTTPQMLVRFPADVLALHPRVVHIMGGTNDIAGNTGPSTLDEIEANIAAMVTLAKAAGIRVVLAAVPPAASFKWSPALKPAPRIAALNQRLRALAARERVVFVDYGTVLGQPDGAMRQELSLDGVHPATAGYALMTPLARQAIAAARR
jgi:lysophospholipase L1-like esterase